LLTVSRSVPSRFPAEIEDLQVDPTGLRITGLADSFATVDQVKRALEQSGDFESIEVTHANSSQDRGRPEPADTPIAHPNRSVCCARAGQLRKARQPRAHPGPDRRGSARYLSRLQSDLCADYRFRR